VLENAAARLGSVRSVANSPLNAFESSILISSRRRGCERFVSARMKIVRS